MAQLRHDYDRFQELGAEVLVVVPNGPRMMKRHVEAHHPPYPIVTDRGARVAASYGIDTKGALLPGAIAVFKPTVFLVDRSGAVRYTNYCSSYIKEPDNGEPLAVLEKLARGEDADSAAVGAAEANEPRRQADECEE